MYSRFFLLFYFMYFDLKKPNLKQVFVGRHQKTSIIRKTDIVIIAHDNECKPGKSGFFGRGKAGQGGLDQKRNLNNPENTDNQENNKKPGRKNL